MVSWNLSVVSCIRLTQAIVYYGAHQTKWLTWAINKTQDVYFLSFFLSLISSLAHQRSFIRYLQVTLIVESRIPDKTVAIKEKRGKKFTPLDPQDGDNEKVKFSRGLYVFTFFPLACAWVTSQTLPLFMAVYRFAQSDMKYLLSTVEAALNNEKNHCLPWMVTSHPTIVLHFTFECYRIIYSTVGKHVYHSC